MTSEFLTVTFAVVGRDCQGLLTMTSALLAVVSQLLYTTCKCHSALFTVTVLEVSAVFRDCQSVAPHSSRHFTVTRRVVSRDFQAL